MELKAFLEYQGFDVKKIEELEEDAAKTEFDSAFIRKSVDAIKKDEIWGTLIGNINGSMATKTKSLFKEMGIEFEPAEIDGKKIEEIFHTGLNKLSNTYTSKITELEGKAGLTNDEAIKAMETELNKYKSQADDFKGKWKVLGEEFEGFKTNLVVESKNNRLNELREKAFSDIKFGEKVSPYEKKGWITEQIEKYKFELNEDGSELVPLTKDGKGIPNPKVAGTLYKTNELLQELAIKDGLYSLNPHAQQVQRTPSQTTNTYQAPVAQAQRPVNQAAINAIGK